MLYSATLFAALTASVSAAKSSRTFAVNHFYGNGPLVEGRMDPIVNPGVASAHAHTIQGGSNFALTMGDSTLLTSTCTSSLIKNDKSNYWTPKVYFHDAANGSFIEVSMFYMNVYYFFEATDDTITAFQPGHRMVVGDSSLRTPPASGGKSITVAGTSDGQPQPVQFTCPRSNYNMPAWPANSNGLSAGIQDPNNQGAGVGFPDVNCDGYASPLRADIHFPSCYNPAAGLDNYKENMAFPTAAANGKQNCPTGWIHTPHLFYEVYWNTPPFANMWTQGQGSQPFVLSNGDNTGYSLHADFISGWDVATLQQIIDNCDAGDSGMDKCPGLIGGVNNPSTSCNIPSAINENIHGVLSALPGNNPVTGFGVSGSPPPPVQSSAASSLPASTAATSPAGGYGYTSSSSSHSTTTTTLATVSHIASVSTTTSPHTSTTTTRTTTTTRYTVTTTASYSSSGPTNPSIPSWTYAACRSDQLNPRAIGTTGGILYANLGPHNVTTTSCVAYCDSHGYTVAGTEYGGQCFCDHSVLSFSTTLPQSSCNMPCEGPGGASQLCGGSWALSVYTKSVAGKRETKKRFGRMEREN